MILLQRIIGYIEVMSSEKYSQIGKYQAVNYIIVDSSRSKFNSGSTFAEADCPIQKS